MDNNRRNGGGITRRRDFGSERYRNSTSRRNMSERSADTAEGDALRETRNVGARRVKSRRAAQSNYAGYGERSASETAAVRGEKAKYEQKQKDSRDTAMRIRCAVLFALCSVVAAMLILMTPIFDVESIHIEGNKVVTKEMVQEKIGEYIGSNIFSVSRREIKNRMCEISQVNDVDVDKSFIPPSITVHITESLPSAYLLYGNTIIVIDSDLRIIDDSGSFDTDTIPSLSGLSVQSYKLNETLVADSTEKEEVLKKLLKTLENAEMINDISYIALDDLTNIKFNYENRIEVQCGSDYEMERKIRMFAQAVASPSIDENAMGTMDISVPGKAVYTP